MVTALQKLDAKGVHVGFKGGLIYSNQNQSTNINETPFAR
ncbi:hypothetical protein HMPREF0061_0075 [Aerococcus viridans ATCC 11563 = CCUG 4311]|uniref:Uncharacterized protein n=1 Tax=Aerococcus viridans (strain ATCC 11563 / DSM 20340 / CCUG 4311 / JCM 20461 / NBRC 12219 / NCTC 8251 / M1) TaxID=655812 RepID=A0ABN0ABF7_AERVM|nr:hypothetical protein HMPREF0061_0075 [Aerococcus viridans ATCC 11563 = CCUG 4311]